MKSFIATLVIFGVILIVCDPTRATPLSRTKRQGWTWGNEDSNETPVRPARPTRPTQPTTAGNVGNPAEDPNASTTTVAPAMFTRCMASCPATQQYNPVCGTNRNTYDNEAKMNCARNCGVDVRKMFNGTCQPVTR